MGKMRIIIMFSLKVLVNGLNLCSSFLCLCGTTCYNVALIHTDRGNLCPFSYGAATQTTELSQFDLLRIRFVVYFVVIKFHSNQKTFIQVLSIWVTFHFTVAFRCSRWYYLPTYELTFCFLALRFQRVLRQIYGEDTDNRSDSDFNTLCGHTRSRRKEGGDSWRKHSETFIFGH